MGKFISANKNIRRKELVENRHNFYLSFFDNKQGYEEKYINGFWLVKQWNPERRHHQVSLYTEESFKRYNEQRQLASLEKKIIEISKLPSWGNADRGKQ